jgi:hypothetical protein
MHTKDIKDMEARAAAAGRMARTLRVPCSQAAVVTCSTGTGRPPTSDRLSLFDFSFITKRHTFLLS